MPSSFSIFGITFYIYGMILGLSMVVAAKVAEQRWAVLGKNTDQFWNAVIWIVGFGIVGSRLWHVATDWHLYSSNVLAALYIWNGGLSIIGALVGGLLGIIVATEKAKHAFTVKELSDVICLGVPFGQALGRIGNWINQELYGLPTNLAWKLYIPPEKRLLGYQSEAYYHPLFAYEALAMIATGVLVWLLSKKSAFFKIGTGLTTVLYLGCYGWIRFGLEFLRIDKAILGQSMWGINQLVMLSVAVVCTIVVLLQLQRRSHEKI